MVKKNEPIFGVIVAPARGELFFGGKTVRMAFKKVWGIKRKKFQKPTSQIQKRGLRAVISRSHMNDQDRRFIEMNNIVEVRKTGSSLKLCNIAMDEVDVYPRYVGSSEWDIAAGHAILSSVGGSIYNINDGKLLTYGKSEFRNPFFVAMSSKYSFNSFLY